MLKLNLFFNLRFDVLLDKKITFVLGGARSGKSTHAESIALNAASGAKPLYYVATAEIFDAEMQKRIDLHKARRGDEWTLIDAPINLTDALKNHDLVDSVFLIDCLSVWTTNLLIGNHDIPAMQGALIDHLTACQASVVLVASETGLGIVPDNKLSRQFRDANGLLNQHVAAVATEVFFVTAGIPNKIK